MPDAEPSIGILNLEVKADNRISWVMSKAAEDRPNYKQNLMDNEEKLHIDYLERSTINFLITELQLLSDWTRDKELQTDTSLLIKILGERLYRVLFVGRISNALSEMLNDDTLRLIRIELEFEDGTLAQWPWEYLYMPDDNHPDTGRFLVKETQLLLNRRLRLAGTKQPPHLKTPRPVKVLFVVSQPRMNPVQCNSVLEKFEELERAGIIELRQLITQTGAFEDEYEANVKWQIFRDTVSSFQPNIIHFIGHGRYTRDGGEVAFVKENGEPDWVRDQDFASWCSNDKTLKLVFLQACESALPDPYRTISGMAMHLARRNIPAVIAMQYRIENEVAATFALGFYDELVKGRSVDLAVKAGRNSMQDKLAKDPLSHAFGLPVLYLSSFESIIVEETVPDVQPKLANLIPGPQSSEEIIKCPGPGCNREMKRSYKFCPHCGFPFQCVFCAPDVITIFDEEEMLGNFCHTCGENLKCGECGQRQVKDKATRLCRQCLELRQKKQAADTAPTLLNRRT